MKLKKPVFDAGKTLSESQAEWRQYFRNVQRNGNLSDEDWNAKNEAEFNRKYGFVNPSA